MKEKMFSVFTIIAILGLLTGPSLWGDVLSIGNETIRIVGCLITIVSLFYLIMFSLIIKALDENSILAVILATLGGLALCVSLFSFFCFVNVVPGMPQTELARELYGWLSLGLLIGGGASTGTSVIIIIFR